jgi:hypothetical protein
MFGRLRARVRAMDRHAVFWTLFVVTVLVAALVFILVNGPGTPCRSDCPG